MINQVPQHLIGCDSQQKIFMASHLNETNHKYTINWSLQYQSKKCWCIVKKVTECNILKNNGIGQDGNLPQDGSEEFKHFVIIFIEISVVTFHVDKIFSSFKSCSLDAFGAKTEFLVP